MMIFKFKKPIPNKLNIGKISYWQTLLGEFAMNYNNGRIAVRFYVPRKQVIVTDITTLSVKKRTLL